MLTAEETEALRISLVVATESVAVSLPLAIAAPTTLSTKPDETDR